MDDIYRYYEILGFEPGATLDQVKQAYRDLVKVWHPDRFLHDPPLQEKAQEKIKDINRAYENLEFYLSDPDPITPRPGTSPPDPPMEPRPPQPSEPMEKTEWKYKAVPPGAAFILFWGILVFIGLIFILAEEQSTKSGSVRQTKLIIKEIGSKLVQAPSSAMKASRNQFLPSLSDEELDRMLKEAEKEEKEIVKLAD